MQDKQQTYLKIIVSLIGIVLLLILYIAAQTNQVEAAVVPQDIYVEKIVEIEKEPEYTHNINSVEREMLARLVYLEANTESLECQQAVASVVINRWLDGRWGKTIASVIYARYQFSPAGLIYKTTPTETNYVAVDHVLKRGSILPKYCMFFRTDYGFSKVWDDYAEYQQIGNTYFGYFLEDK